MEVLGQELKLLSYSCLSLATIADFWHLPLKSCPPGCCRPESKHYKEIKYKCEKHARMALPPSGTFCTPKRTSLTGKLYGDLLSQALDLAENAMSVNRHIPHL